MRWFGAGLADFLATTPPYDATPAAAEMARFEWALGEAFDAPTSRRSAAEALMSLPPEAWETISFAPLPSLRRLVFAFDVPPTWQRREEVEPGALEVAALARAGRLGGLAARAACPISARSSPTRRRCSTP